MNIDKEFQINTDFLDTIDFVPYLAIYQSLAQLMAVVEEDYKNVDMPPELQGELFNCYNESDFKDYLLERYHNLYFYPIEDYLIDFRSDE